MHALPAAGASLGTRALQSEHSIVTMEAQTARIGRMSPLHTLLLQLIVQTVSEPGRGSHCWRGAGWRGAARKCCQPKTLQEEAGLAPCSNPQHWQLERVMCRGQRRGWGDAAAAAAAHAAHVTLLLFFCLLHT